MTAIISHNKGKETRWGRCQRYGSCSTARRWIQGSQTPLGNSVCQLCFIAFRSPFSIISRGITLTIYACTPCKHQWVRTKIIWASSPQLKILWKVFFPFRKQLPPPPSQSLAQNPHPKHHSKQYSWTRTDGITSHAMFSRSWEDFLILCCLMGQWWVTKINRKK